MGARLAWPGLVVTLGLTLVAGPALAKDCTREMPVPVDARLAPRAANVPDDVARFAGAWLGAWKNRDGSDGLCAALIVEEVFANGIARVVYSYGVDKAFGAEVPNAWRATGRIADGVLSVVLPSPGRPVFTFTFDDGKLKAKYRGEGDGTLLRAGNLADIGCPRVASAAPPRPSFDGHGPSSPSTADAPRDRLTAAELLAAVPTISGLIHNDYFVPIGPTAPPRHALKGVLTVTGSTVTIHSLGCTVPSPMPAFSAAFFTHGEHLVPAVRTILEPPGILILSPGRVWSEPGDGGMSRASFPFVTINQVTNQAHNGIAAFLYDDTRVSSLRVQVAQETASWARFDVWGQAQMTYAPGPVAGEDALRAQFVAELARETPLRAWSTLPVPAPLRDAFDGDAKPDDVSANGLVVDGVLYLKDCPTRAGPFPYCRHMRHGVFSVTKSMGAAVALLRLAQKYGDAVFDAKIADHLTVTALHDGWKGVTFADALNMATGIGDLAPQREPNEVYADENKPKMARWMRARTARQKLEIAFSYGKYSWGPGEVLRYTSTQTFLLAAAMDAFLKQKEGPDAHLWDMVTREVYEPIGIAHAPAMHTLEPDGRRGVPLLAYGLYPTVDDVAKLVTLLQNGGRHDGRQILHAGKVAEALRRTAVTGLPSGAKNRFGEGRYLLSFWSVPYRTDTDCFFQIPYMAGFGGNVVALLPSGVSVFRFADGETWDLETMIRAGEAVRPFCASTTAAAPARRALTAAEAEAALRGHTFSAGDTHIFFAPDGIAFRKSKDSVDAGTWRIADDGGLCRTWHVVDGGRARCFDVYRTGETVELQTRDRWSTTILERRTGNPERF
jgi:hypothetical protein